MQRAAAHVDHAFVFGQVLFDVGGLQGVGQLQAELDPFVTGGIQHRADQGNAVVVLEIMPESLVRDLGFETESVVEDIAQAFGAKQGRVQFDGSVKTALLDKVTTDFLDFLRRTAVHGGHGDVVGHGAGDAQFFHTRIERGNALDLFSQLGGAVAHVVEKMLHSGAFDALKIIAGAHIEDKARLLRSGPSQLVPEDIDKNEGVKILVEGLVEL